jgi:hypothetical protein
MKQPPSLRLAAERIKVRAEMKSMGEEDPDTSVVHMQAQQRVAKHESVAPTSFWDWSLKLAKLFPGWGLVLVACVLVGVVAWRGVTWFWP